MLVFVESEGHAVEKKADYYYYTVANNKDRNDGNGSHRHRIVNVGLTKLENIFGSIKAHTQSQHCALATTPLCTPCASSHSLCIHFIHIACIQAIPLLAANANGYGQ